MFVFDIETMGVESTAVVLSAALVHFDFESEFTYKDLLYKSCFVKFNAKQQINEYNRTITKSTLEWWDKQGDVQKIKSLIPSNTDLTVQVGCGILQSFMDAHDPKREQTIWIRGSLDQICFESLTRAAGLPELAYFNKFRDVRTALDLMKDTSKGSGYCDIPNFDRDVVIKHDPVHDCAYDAMMLRYGV
jgi:hypothetical protein